MIKKLFREVVFDASLRQAMDSGGVVQQEAQTSAIFCTWKYKHYFVIVEEGEKNIRAHCKL